MRRPLSTSFALAAALVGLAATGSRGAPPERGVAKVELVHGAVFVQDRALRTGVEVEGGRALQRGERLAAGNFLVSKRWARLVLRFDNGRRFAVLENTRAVVRRRGLETLNGKVLELPAFQPIARGENPGAPGGPRIRMGAIEDLYPRGGLSALTDRTVLRFRAAGPASRYRVEVYDGKGRTVFSQEVETNAVHVPSKALHTGERYFWKVRSVGRPGPVEEGQAVFFTLPREVARQRERLRIEGARNKDVLPVLALIDRELGLLAEAKAELEEALARHPEGEREDLRKELEEVEAELAAAGGS